jgi:hypothetical protein
MSDVDPEDPSTTGSTVKVGAEAGDGDGCLRYSWISLSAEATSRSKEDSSLADDPRCDLRIRLEHFRPELTDQAVELHRYADLTGFLLWPAAHQLALRLVQVNQPLSVNGSPTSSPAHPLALDLSTRLCELGAGHGLPGIVAAHYAGQCLLTDGSPHMVQLLQKNLLLNGAFTTSISAECSTRSIRAPSQALALRWNEFTSQDSLENPDPSRQAELAQLRAQFDVVLAADAVYVSGSQGHS